MMSRSEVEKFREAIRALLADEDAELTTAKRYRWQGSLAAVEAILGQESELSPGNRSD